MYVTVLTWNMHEETHPKNLNTLLDVNIEFNKTHIYVIYLQEAKNFTRDLVNYFDKYDYQICYSYIYGTIETYIFIKKNYPILFSSIFETFTYSVRIFPTIYKTKGVIATLMTFKKKSILFLNVHLIPHNKNYKKRINNIERIFDAIEEHYGNFDQFDIVIFGGDLNFRLNYGPNDKHNFQYLLKSCKFKKLIKHFDQLKLLKKETHLLDGFQENEINFMPTFKYQVNASIYSKKAIPSYTDRILYKVSHRKKQMIKCKNYNSLQFVNNSDHKPVQAVFQMKF